MITGFAERMAAEERARLPKAKGASEAMQHDGGSCPVHPLQPISVWYGSNDSRHGWWIGVHTAQKHDWRLPCVYRTREPRKDHPYAKIAPLQTNDDASKISNSESMKSIAQDFTRLVDAVENFLARFDFGDAV